MSNFRDLIMKSVRFYLKLTPETLLEYYQGGKRFVRVKTYAGYSIQFRAEHLRAWVTHQGIDGEFEITFDHSNSFHSLFMVRSALGAIPIQAGSKSNPPITHMGQRPRGGFKKSV